MDFYNTIYFNQYEDLYVINENTFVADDVHIYSNKLHISESLWLMNNGEINSDIYLCDDCELVLINAGEINGDFIVGDKSRLVRMVDTLENAAPIDINVGYVLVVDNVVGLNVSQVVNEHLDKMIISDSVVKISDLQLNNVEVHGDVFFELVDVQFWTDRALVNNVSGDGRILVDVKGLGPLYAVQSYFVDDDLYVRTVRETDYAKILDGNVGNYLNKLRIDRPDDKLLATLDVAENLNQINEIMAESVRIAPFSVMNNVRVFNLYNLRDFDAGTRVGGRVVAADNMLLGDVGTRIAFASDNVHWWGGFNFGKLNVDAPFEEYGAYLYSVSVGAQYELNSLFVRSDFGFTLAQFDLENVFDGAGIINKPVGYIGAINVEGGYEYSVSGFELRPFVGVYMDYMKLLGWEDTEFAGRIGGEASCKFDMLGVEYKYGMRLDFDSLYGVGFGVFGEFLSGWDDIGGRVSVSSINDNKIGRSYEICADIRFVF